MIGEVEFLHKIGVAIRELRLIKGLTQLQLSIDAGIPLSQIGAIERGVGNPTIKTLKKIADCLECEVFQLFIFNK